MFGLSFGHILILFLVILLFGAKRLPELGAALGRGMRAFKKGLEGREDEEAQKITQQNKPTTTTTTATPVSGSDSDPGKS